MQTFVIFILTILSSVANALICSDQNNLGYSISFMNGVLQGAHIDSETTEYPILQYSVLKKKIEVIDDAADDGKDGTKAKVTKILKVEYRAPGFKLVVDYSQLVNWKQSSDTGKSTTLTDAKTPAYPATVVVNGKSSKLYCRD